jgi:hypothetical protein
MKTCVPCSRAFMSWSAFGKHMIHQHGVDRDAFWRRANQCGDSPVSAVQEVGSGRWALMVQGRLAL